MYMINVCMTGSTGVLGRLMIDKLSHSSDFNITKITANIEHEEHILHDLPAQCDILIHLAAKVSTNQVNNSPDVAFNTNCIGTYNLISAVKRKYSELPYIFYSSTSHVYKPNDQPLDEQSRVQPHNIYGKTKLAGELALSSCYPGDKYCIGRIFSYYHESQKPPFLYPNIISRLNNHTSDVFEIPGGNSIRDFLNAEDVCNHILGIVKQSATGIINIGSGVPESICEFIKRVCLSENCNLKLKPVGDSNTIYSTGTDKRFLND